MCMQNIFDVEDIHKDTILSELAKIHRKWRADVAKKYIFDRDGNINLEPPLIYHGIISHEDWIIFVKKHTENEEFMVSTYLVFFYVILIILVLINYTCLSK